MIFQILKACICIRNAAIKRE